MLYDDLEEWDEVGDGREEGDICIPVADSC